MAKVQRALLSVSDKRGLVELGQALRRHGVELVSSGGTARALREAGLEVTTVSDYTGFPEILDGRVKTLHPKVFAGILARPTPEHEQQLAREKLGRIDLVVVNLYPFERTIASPETDFAQAVEQIDIGGPSLVRAAAKNLERAAVLVDPEDYGRVMEELDQGDGELSAELRRQLAGRAFAYTAAYDAAISNYFQRQLAPDEAWPERISLQLSKVQPLRYGENPHQGAGFYALVERSDATPRLGYEQLHGKELSFNNIIDVDAAWALVQDLPAQAVCIIKHTNPCGAASVTDGGALEAYRRALQTDPVSAFGGIVGSNQPVDAALAAELKEIFLEAVVAPAFSEEALAILGKKKGLRLIRADANTTRWSWRSALGGVLLQDADAQLEHVDAAQLRTARAPTPQELEDLQFAWVVCKHVKSNAIVLAKDRRLVGVGAGQMSRVDSVELAVSKARMPVAGCVLASDAFFPFRDGVDKAAEAGAVAVVQPGGSVRDEEVIAAANERGLAMVFTGARHFRH